jgi:hypothetical protein
MYLGAREETNQLSSENDQKDSAHQTQNHECGAEGNTINKNTKSEQKNQHN